jgi:FKBP-type peptidyl-prolyl cis-trans isomerase 2
MFDEEEKQEVLSLDIWGSPAKVFAGDSKTFVIKATTTHKENDTISLSITNKPDGWDAVLNLSQFDLGPRSSFSVFLVVNISSNAEKGDYRIKIAAESSTKNVQKTKSAKVKVIEDKGQRAAVGDKVEVDYVGYLTEYKVFDTSVLDIGRENTVQKTPDFRTRPTYEPLKVYVNLEDTDFSDEYIQVVEGFWEGIVGMREGQSRSVTLPPAKAYGDFTNATLNITEEVAMIETMTLSEFDLNYPGEEPLKGMILAHHFWGWNISINHINESEDIVEIQNEPDINETVDPYLWESKVIYKNQSDNGGEGRILVRHYAQAGTEAIYLGYDAEVLSFGDGKILIEYNKSSHNLGNKILIFDITLIKIVE